jgi:hypothetical protein
MQALFTGALGDFIGAECFMTEEEKDAVTTILWATRNRAEIQSAVDLSVIFPNLKDQKILFDDFADERPTRPWEPGDRFAAIGMKHELNLKCGLNLSNEEMDAISDHSLDATLQRIFSGLRFQSSRFATRSTLPDISRLNLPQRYVVIHPWSDAEINGREFDDADWNNIYDFLNTINAVGVVVNRSSKPAPTHPKLIDLTNQTTLKETFAIIAAAESCILCASSLACFATKIFPPHRIWLKGGHEHMFSQWATYFYHGPFTDPNSIIFRTFDVLKNYKMEDPQAIARSAQADMLDQGMLTLL